MEVLLRSYVTRGLFNMLTQEMNAYCNVLPKQSPYLAYLVRRSSIKLAFLR